MTNILHEIAERTKTRIETKKCEMPLDEMSAMARAMPRGNFGFAEALRSESGDISFICEVKKASPSKGIIAENFNHLEIAQNYEKAGAAAISVLTEPFWFKGADKYLREIADTVKIPLLRKDFTVDSYMIYEAKLLGASAVLFICAILEREQLAEYIKIADELGLCSLVEVHDEAEVEMALSANARIIGVNNRNLKTFEVDITLSERLRGLVPRDIIFVAESGIKTREDVQRLREAGADAVLVGETLMRGAELSCLKPR
jgi:indole-3-glycerol phosphate synthase